MDKSTKNALQAHVRFAKSNYEEIANGKYIVSFKELDTYILEFKFSPVDQEYAEYRLTKNDELVFFIKHEHYDASDFLIDYIDSL